MSDRTLLPRFGPRSRRRADLLAEVVEQGAPVLGRCHGAEPRVAQQLGQLSLPPAERRHLLARARYLGH